VSGPDLIIARLPSAAGASGAEAIRRIQEEYGVNYSGIPDYRPTRLRIRILEARA